MSIFFKDLNKQDMNDFLSKLNHFPAKRTPSGNWYYSIFRPKENTPSFRVKYFKGQYRYDDFATGEHGNLTDLCLRYFQINEQELFRRINSDRSIFSFDQPSFSKYKAVQKEKEVSDNYGLSVHELTNEALLSYLGKRNIVDTTIIHARLKELHVKYPNGKGYFMIGFPNDKGGWAARNKYFKGAFGYQGTSLLRNNSGTQKLILFEGFMDALSFLQVIKRKAELFPPDMQGGDVLVLNSLNNLAQTEQIFSNYDQVHTMLDMDSRGQEWTKTLLAADPKFTNRSSLFSPYKDFNEWHIAQCSIALGRHKQKLKRGLKM